jgi:hypothetical protein
MSVQTLQTLCRASIKFQNLKETKNAWHWKSHFIGKEGKALYFGSHKPKSGVNDSQTSTKGSPDFMYQFDEKINHYRL